MSSSLVLCIVLAKKKKKKKTYFLETYFSAVKTEWSGLAAAVLECSDE